MKLLYFTATGNSLYVAKRIGGELISIPKAIKEENYNLSDEKIGIIFPSYAISVPPYVIDFLKKAKLNSNYLFAVVTYGMSPGATSHHLLDIAKQVGLSFSYVNTIKMVDTWLPAFDMDAQINGEHKKEIDKHLNVIMSDIASSKQWIIKVSIMDKLLTKLFLKRKKPTSRKEKAGGYIAGTGVDEFFVVEDTCTQCSTCAKVCPVDNIKVNNSKPFFHRQCISCLACTQNCPQNAIRLKGEKSRARFRNQHIKLNEIINAND